MVAGMPGGRQRALEFQLPWPPFAWSAILASRIAWYSGVNGAPCPSPQGLVWSKLGWPPDLKLTRSHWPETSGYFASSKACAIEPARTTSKDAQSATRFSMSVSAVCRAKSEERGANGEEQPGGSVQLASRYSPDFPSLSRLLEIT